MSASAFTFEGEINFTPPNDRLERVFHVVLYVGRCHEGHSTEKVQCWHSRPIQTIPPVGPHGHGFVAQMSTEYNDGRVKQLLEAKLLGVVRSTLPPQSSNIKLLGTWRAG